MIINDLEIEDIPFTRRISHTNAQEVIYKAHMPDGNVGYISDHDVVNLLKRQLEERNDNKYTFTD